MQIEYYTFSFCLWAIFINIIRFYFLCKTETNFRMAILKYWSNVSNDKQFHHGEFYHIGFQLKYFQHTNISIIRSVSAWCRNWIVTLWLNILLFNDSPHKEGGKHTNKACCSQLLLDTEVWMQTLTFSNLFYRLSMAGLAGFFYTLVSWAILEHSWIMKYGLATMDPVHWIDDRLRWAQKNVCIMYTYTIWDTVPHQEIDFHTATYVPNKIKYTARCSIGNGRELSTSVQKFTGCFCRDTMCFFFYFYYILTKSVSCSIGSRSN